MKLGSRIWDLPWEPQAQPSVFPHLSWVGSILDAMQRTDAKMYLLNFSLQSQSRGGIPSGCERPGKTVSRVTNGLPSLASTVIPAQVAHGLPVSVSLTAGDEQKLLLLVSIELRASLGLRLLFHPSRHDLVHKKQALPLFLYWHRGCALIYCWFSMQLWLCSYWPASLAAARPLRFWPDGNSVSEGPGYVVAAKYRF